MATMATVTQITLDRNPGEIRAAGTSPASTSPRGLAVPPKARILLEEYAGLSPTSVERHVEDIRDRVSRSWPQTSIGQVRFLRLGTSEHPDYARALEKLQRGGTYLEAGCGLGQDLRQLVQDLREVGEEVTCPPEPTLITPRNPALYAIDIEPGLFELGFDLFRDRTSLPAIFCAADLTKPLSGNALTWEGTMDCISCENLFHHYGVEAQTALACTLVQLARPKAGSMIFGAHVGHVIGVNEPAPGKEFSVGKGGRMYKHSGDTWDQLWRRVGAITGSSWAVAAWREDLPVDTKDRAWYSQGTNILHWSVTRLS